MGMGMVARDHNKQFIAGLCAPQQFISDPTTAKALAAWKMVEFCINPEFENVVLEGDCQELVQALVSEDDCWGRFGLLINDTKQLLRRIKQ